MKIDGACHCGYIRIEAEADPEKTTICHCTDCQTGTGSAFRVPRLGPCIRGIVQDVRAADDLSQDHGGERPSAAADLLPPLRLADLFDHAGRGAAGVLHGACWYPAPARPIRAAAAELVPLCAALGNRARRRSQKRKTGFLSRRIEEAACHPQLRSRSAASGSRIR
jgi:hypothetical protein